MDVVAVIVGSVAAIMASLSGIMLGYFAFKTSSAKMQFDADMIDLKKRVENCDKERGEAKQRISEITEKAEKAEQMSIKHREELVAAERELKSVRADLIDLRDRFIGGQNT